MKAKITCWIVKKIFRAKGDLYKIWVTPDPKSFVDSLPESEVYPVRFENKYRSRAWLSFFVFFLKLFKHNYFFRKGKIYWRTEPSLTKDKESKKWIYFCSFSIAQIGKESLTLAGLQGFMKRAYKT